MVSNGWLSDFASLLQFYRLKDSPEGLSYVNLLKRKLKEPINTIHFCGKASLWRLPSST
jgi:hypothetical protein